MICKSLIELLIKEICECKTHDCSAYRYPNLLYHKAIIKAIVLDACVVFVVLQ